MRLYGEMLFKLSSMRTYGITMAMKQIEKYTKNSLKSLKIHL